jgi:glucose/arabinose dehydrogenase
LIQLWTAPNGDFFLAESSSGKIKVFRGITSEGKPEQDETFATGLNQPYGIAFYPPGDNPQWVYVGNTDSVVRFPYKNGDLKASGAAQNSTLWTCLTAVDIGLATCNSRPTAGS